MSTFTLDSDNNITALTGLPSGADRSDAFSNAKELAKLTAQWPASRLVATWNSFAGVAPFNDLKPVKRFTSRKASVERIWQAVTRLSPGSAPRAEPVTPTKGKAKKSPAKAVQRAEAQADAPPKPGSKKAEVIAMMKYAKGASLTEILHATGWQKHTVRAFMSILGRAGELKVESFKNTAGERSYRLAT